MGQSGGREKHERARCADLILVDAAPLLVGDAIALSAHVDALVIVTHLKGFARATLEDMKRILEACPAEKLGFILTGAEKMEGYGRYSANAAAAELRSARVLHMAAPSSASANGSAAASTREESGVAENEENLVTSTTEKRQTARPKSLGAFSAGRRQTNSCKSQDLVLLTGSWRNES